MKKSLIAFVITLLVSAGASFACSPQDQGAINKIVAQTNAYRAQKGLPPVKLDANVSRAALSHACDMTQKGYFAHNGSDGSKPMQRMKASGVKGCMFAENIAMGPANIDVMSMWLNSSGHRHNIELPSVDKIGVAMVKGSDGQIRWVQNFAQSCAATKTVVVKRRSPQPKKSTSGWQTFTW